MAVITSGKIFANGEQLSADKLNQVITGATFSSTDAVDGSTITLVGGAMSVRDTGITTAKIEDSSSKTTGVTFAKMQHIGTAKILGRTTGGEGDIEETDIVIGSSGDAGLLFDNDDMLDNSDTAGGSATRGATQQSIKAFVTAMRPKFVALTGATHSLNNVRTASGTGTFTYNIADFTSGDSDFATSKIVGLVVSGVARTNELENKVTASLPDGTEVTICSALAAGAGDNVSVETLTTVPINSDTTTLTIKLVVGQVSTNLKAESTIRGAIILPAL
jgi:hypothetical protein|tara:strand:+ start:849 stop:1676 length:828 start_codon:yes stop_codon:yes gene_type:complete